MKRLIVEGWNLTATGDATVIWVACHPTWREPAVAYAELVTSGTPVDVAREVREVRRRTGRVPECSVMMNEGGETLGLVDGYANAGMPVSPTPKGWTEALGVMRVASLLRRQLTGRDGRVTRRFMVVKSCRLLVAGLDGVRWADNRPVLEGTGSDAVRALSAAMSVLPPEPRDPINVMQELGESVMPSVARLDRMDVEEPRSVDDLLEEWGSRV